MRDKNKIKNKIKITEKEIIERWKEAYLHISIATTHTHATATSCATFNFTNPAHNATQASTTSITSIYNKASCATSAPIKGNKTRVRGFTPDLVIIEYSSHNNINNTIQQLIIHT